MEEITEKPKLPYMKHFIDDFELWDESIQDDHDLREFLRAKVRYMKTMEKEEVPISFRAIYLAEVKNINACRKKYENTCVQNKENRNKSKDKTPKEKEPQWKPPTQKDFISYCECLLENDFYESDYDPDKADIKDWYKYFSGENWKVLDIPITTDEECKAVVYCYMKEKAWNDHDWEFFLSELKLVNSISEHEKVFDSQCLANDCWNYEKGLLIIDDKSWLPSGSDEAARYLYENKIKPFLKQ